MSFLAKAYDPKALEEKWVSFWDEGGYFQADPNSKKPPFSIVLPPPNVTGKLHMGHALVDTLQDLLIRWKRMQGFEALWVPGTDHAGIATQMVVERELFRKTGKRKHEFRREEFLAHLWEWKEQCEGEVLFQLKRLGCSCDWSRLRFTMDAKSNQAVRTAFKQLFDAGLIYQGDYLVNWDPVAQTALSDDEVEHEELPSFLWHIRYPLVDKEGFLIVATTRPETLFGDVAVAVHPEDERYRHLIGKKVILPLSNREIPIIGDPFVDPAFGTGAVKVTPAHDFNDFEVGRRHELPLINILTMDARLNEKTGIFAGQPVEEGRKAVVNSLKQEGLLEKEEPHLLRVGVSYRSKAILQPYLSKQWFIKMAPFKEKLISAVKEKRIQLIPQHWEATYYHWIENLRDWCISRQLWWGHQIPIWYKGDQILCYGGEGVPPEVAKNPTEWSQDPDVLDTWFSSALWPLSTMGWPEKTPELKRFYPTSVLVTGHDILFFWVARMILMGEFFSNEPPFHEVFLHGLIYGKSYWRKESNGSISYLTKEEKKRYDLGEKLPSDIESKWEKMSKTKGNIIDPIEVLSTYGTDALRLGLASSATGARQIDLDERRFEEYRNFVNKIWNGSRFVFLNIEALLPQTFCQGLDLKVFSLEDRWILSVLNRTIKEMDEALSNYAFDRATTLGYEFFWNDFCSIYLEASKPLLFGKRGDATTQEERRKLLAIILLTSLRLLHPIIPFITEELFSLFKSHFSHVSSLDVDPYTQEATEALQAKCCTVAPYPVPAPFRTQDLNAEKEFTLLIELVKTVRNIRTEMAIPPSEKTEMYLIGPELDSLLLVKKEKHLLLALTPTSEIHFAEKSPSHFGARKLWEGMELFIPLPASLKQKEEARLQKEREKLEKTKSNIETQLANSDFRARAPQEIVEKLQKTLTQIELQLQEIGTNLSALSQ
ncbi:MAG TPA: valine--tRNA ligase [Chlamydiales bacterium]|nr:valine--tRNA ligase [Chlamydiales bacterium]